MALLGEPVSAEKAVDWGLINFAWPDAEFAARADALLQRLADGPTRSYAGSKRELNHWLYDRMDAHLQLEASTQRELATSADFIEGVGAFLQKRPAKFTGK
jgi:2-(1,2-epoxy-1,2-dihydrophenyl)acetyl-CoA isomerase